MSKSGVSHRDEEYEESGFEVLRDMQSRHFWYRGRHRFLLAALQQVLGDSVSNASMIDLGGGCGGWLRYLRDHLPHPPRQMALADSSLIALRQAGEFLGQDVRRYQVDLLQLPWKNQWDVIFLLDVLEHLPDDEVALRNIHAALKPGGLLLVTTPALRCFWSTNDDLAHHVRRYSRGDFARLANRVGLKLRLSRYFMFFLSPLLVISRWGAPRADQLRPDEAQTYMMRTHQVPSPPINSTLSGIFALETPLGVWFPFPWGTSVLGVFQKSLNS